MATLKNTTINDTGHLTLPAGTTAQRPASPVIGMIRYNTSLGFSEQYTADGWQGIAPPPIITSISPTSFNGESGTSITINGSNFDTTVTVQFILTGGTVLNATTTTRVSSAQLTATVPRDLLATESPATVKVVNGSGLAASLENALTFADVPVFATASGSIGQIYDGSRSSLAHLSSLAATDAASGSIASYAIVSGAVPSGLSFNTSTAALSGTANAVGSDTTSTFTVRATDNAGNTTDRSFSITVRAPVVVSYTSTGSGTFSVPTGVANARVVVIAGGGGGGTRDTGAGNPGSDGGSGGGAGGMIDHPAFPLTPGGSVSYTVGAGGLGGGQSGRNPGGQIPGAQGSNSTFATLTAIGGGFGGCGPLTPNPGGPGGSGGGEGGGGGTSGGPGAAGTGVQPSQPGASGTFGYGFPGVQNSAPAPHTGSGGGGAGGAATAVGGGGVASPGGPGRASTVTGSSVTYAGGGGGGDGGASYGTASSGGSGGGGPGGSTGNGMVGQNGASNTGGGGGGGGGAGPAPSGGQGGTGGPGIVIIRY
jgi:hypothetical protein